MKRFSIFRSILGTSLFFGTVLGILVVSGIVLPMKQDKKDFLILASVLIIVILSQVMVNLENVKEKFLKIFITSFLTFCFFPLSFLTYFTIQHVPVVTEWPTLLGLGALICAILSFFVLFIRENSRQRNTDDHSVVYREAQTADITQIQTVRHLVKENTLSDPALMTDSDCEEYITTPGKGWVCEIDERIVGFAIADLRENNIRALFIDPEFEKQGIGKKLHETMLDWYFAQTQQTVWLGIAPDTRAEGFYRKAGWKVVGVHGKEIKFEMTFEDWKNLRLITH